MNRRKPFIVEFTGTPEAGKTTVINRLCKELLQKGYKVKLYPESAENTPEIFPKGCVESNLWRNFDTFKHVLEAPYLLEYDIVIFDRGAIDRIFWIYMDSIYDFDTATKNAPFMNIMKDYPPDLLISFNVSAETSIKRRGGEGRLVTKEFVTNYNNLLNIFINSIEINKVIISTDNQSIEQVLDRVLENILEHLREPP